MAQKNISNNNIIISGIRKFRNHSFGVLFDTQVNAGL